MKELAVIPASLDFDGELSKILGPQIAASYDTQLFNVTDSLTEDYNGGVWEMVLFEVEGTKGFYLRLKSDAHFDISVTTNMFEGRTSAEALSIIANLHLLNALVWKAHSQQDQLVLERLSKLYYALLDATQGHPESHLILGAID